MKGFLAGAIIGVGAGVGLAACMGMEPAGPTAVAEAVEPTRPAYMLVLGKVHDRAAFGTGYVAKLPPLYARFGGEYLAVGRGVEVLEGDYAPESFVIGKWPSMDAAQAFWTSPEYDELRRARIDNGWGEFDVLLIEGLPAPVQEAEVSPE